MRRSIRSNPLAVLLALALGLALSPSVGHAAGALTTLVDSTSATQARVDGAGALRVGDGNGPMTVDGAVTTREAQPTKAWSKSGSASTVGGTTIRGPVVAGTVLTHLTVAQWGTTAARAQLWVSYGPSGYSILPFVVPPNGTITIPLTQGFRIAMANSTLILKSLSGVSLNFIATGYDI